MAFVYVFQSGSTNHFKIGRTKGDIEDRRKDLSTGNPQPLVLFDHIETDYDSLVEKYLHTLFFEFSSQDSDAKEFFNIAPDALRQGLSKARKFLENYIPLYLEAEALKSVEPTEEIKTADDHILELYKELRRLKGKIEILKFEYQMIENELKSKVGNAMGIDGVAMWKTQVSLVLDQKSLKENLPGVAEEYTIERRSRIFKLA
jgi:predicted phage-related endonuclease